MHAMKIIQRFIALLFFLFLLPIVTGQLPFPNNKIIEKPVTEKAIVYAATSMPEVTPMQVTPKQPKVLFVYTHSHEAYKPAVQSVSGLEAVYDDQTNIFSLQQAMINHFQLNSIEANVLDMDVQDVMNQTGAKFHEAYKTVRPVLQQELSTNMYDLVIDFHRDAAGKSVTTLKTPEMNFAKVAFVVGAEHPGYEGNLAYAESLNNTLNTIVPGISRGIMIKERKDGDGVYNQDLFRKMILIELGGIDNTEEEVLRTVAVLAQAIAKTIVSEQL